MCELCEEPEMTDEEASFWAAVSMKVFGLVLADLILHPEGARRILGS